MEGNLGRVRFHAATVVADALKLVAVGVAVLTVLVFWAVMADDSTDGGTRMVSAFLAVAGGTTSALLLGAAGYGLEVLVDSFSQLSEIRINTELLADGEEAEEL